MAGKKVVDTDRYGRMNIKKATKDIGDAVQNGPFSKGPELGPREWTARKEFPVKPSGDPHGPQRKPHYGQGRDINSIAKTLQADMRNLRNNTNAENRRNAIKRK